MGKPLAYNATITDRRDLTDKLAIFRVQPDPAWVERQPGGRLEFEGGQYATLGLNHPSDPDKGSTLRPYSIASPPEQRDTLDFYVRFVDRPESDNPLTHLLWPLKAGDRIFIGPKIVGHFTLPATVGIEDPRLKVFVAAGTGLAPFVSIILSYVRRGADPNRFAVLHGAREPRDLGYRDELRMVFGDLAARYMPTISRPGEAAGWAGDVGRVETFFDDQKLSELESRLGLPERGLTPERAVVYICGLYGTIHNTLVRLMRRGFVPNDRRIRKGLGLNHMPPTLFFEQYDKESVLDLNNRDEIERLIAETPFAGLSAPGADD